MEEDHWHDARGRTNMDITGFGTQKGKLTVAFDHKGKRSVYVYTTQESGLCCRMDRAESIGAFFHRYVRILPYAKVA